MADPLLQVHIKPEMLRQMRVIAVEKETSITNIIREAWFEYAARNKHLLTNGVTLNE